MCVCVQWMDGVCVCDKVLYAADKGLRAETSCIQLLISLLRIAHRLFTYDGSCVCFFAEFEQIAIWENEANWEEIRRHFYGVNQCFPLSVQVVYHVNFSN